MCFLSRDLWRTGFKRASRPHELAMLGGLAWLNLSLRVCVLKPLLHLWTSKAMRGDTEPKDGSTKMPVIVVLWRETLGISESQQSNAPDVL